MNGADLIVTIACIIVAVLTLGAAGGSARRLAEELVCLGNNEVLTGAWLAYADDNDGQLVAAHTDPGNWVDRPSASGSTDLETDAIRRGLLFPYVGDLNAYHCPADQTINEPNYPVFRTYAIAGGANGESWAGYDRARLYADLESPATRYVFVEQSSPRGSIVGSWQMNPKTKTWVDPLAMWHEEATTLGFADGHAEVHRWHDQSLIDWCRKAMEKDASFTFNMAPPADEPEDVTYMAEHFPYKSLR